MKQIVCTVVSSVALALCACGGAQQPAAETAPTSEPASDDDATTEAAMPEGETGTGEGGAADPETTEEVIETSEPI